MEQEALTREVADLRLAERLRNLRQARRWSLDELSALSGVSRASLSRIENGDVSPTASVLGRLAGAHGLTFSRLIAELESDGPALVSRADQREWVDPATGFRRRSVSPPSPDFDCELLSMRIARRRPDRLSAAAPARARASSLSARGRARADDRRQPPSAERRRLSPVQAVRRESLPRDRAAAGALRSRIAMTLMPAPPIAIAALDPTSFAEATGRLAEILHACVHEGASVGFILPFDVGEARASGATGSRPRMRREPARPHREPRRRYRRNGAARSRLDAEQAPSRRGVQGAGRPARFAARESRVR